MNVVSPESPVLGTAVPRRFTQIDAISLGFFAAVLLLSIFAAVTLKEEFRARGHLLVAAIVFSYGVFAWWKTRHDAMLSFRMGETLYLLGYVATICGLGAIAWQIGQDPTLLTGPKVPAILARGSLALLSTVIGLIGMNYLRSHGQSLDLQRGQTQQEAWRLAEQLEQVLRKTEKERAETFLQAFQSADLTQQLANLVKSLQTASDSLAAFKTDAQDVRQTWTDTLAGLAGLNGALREFQELAAELRAILAGLGEGIRGTVSLAQTTQNTTAVLNQLGASVVQLQQTAAALHAGLVPLEAGLASFRVDAEQAMQSWLGLQSGLGSLNAALRQFKELADASTTSWAGLAGQLAQVPQLNQAVQSTATALGQLSSAVSLLQQTVSGAQPALAPLSTDLARAMQVLQERLAALPPLADAVGRFVELANRVAPTVEVLGSTFQDIRSINENLRLAVQSLQSFNDQLNSANKATGSVADNADKLMKSTDTLVEEVRNQVHKLTSLTSDLEHIGKTAHELVPAMEPLKSALGTVQQFSARITEVVEALGQAHQTLGETKTTLREVPAVVRDFMDTTRKLLAEAEEGRSHSR